jgi:hypothetical protein
MYQDSFSTAQQAPDGTSFRIIVVSTEDEAGRLARQISAGARFAALAVSRSIDPSADHGGLIGPIALSALRPELREALDGGARRPAQRRHSRADGNWRFTERAAVAFRPGSSTMTTTAGTT